MTKKKCTNNLLKHKMKMIFCFACSVSALHVPRYLYGISLSILLVSFFVVVFTYMILAVVSGASDIFLAFFPLSSLLYVDSSRLSK